MRVKWYHIAIVVALLLGAFLGRKTKGGSTVRVVETIHDTIPVPFRIDSLIYVTDTIQLPSTIDTGAVIEAFYSRRLIDTTVVVNEARIKFTGTLFENNLRNVTFSLQNLRPTQVVVEMKWSLWGGVNIGNEVLAPSISGQYDKHRAGIAYNLIGQNQLIFSYQYMLWQH